MLIIRSTLLVVFLLITSCSKSPTQQSPAKQSDESQQQAELRFAALSPGIAVMLRDLGYEDQIVAKHDYDMILSDRVPPAGSELGFDLEVLIESNPTHLFFQTTTADRSPALLKLAEDKGWIIFERPLNTLEDIASTMDDLYYLFKGAPQSQPDQFSPIPTKNLAPLSEALAMAWDDLGPAADAAGRVLVLGSVDPIGAMGPGSYHYQIIERLGVTPAITDGAMWIELDYEDLITLNPDSIILIAPRQPTHADRFAQPERTSLEIFGPIAQLPISAVQSGHIGVIDHPLGLLPSGALGDVAEDISELLRSWND